MTRYLSIYVLAAVGLTSLVVDGLATFALPVLVFGLIPLAELLFPGTTANLTPDEEQARLADRRFDLVLFGVLPVVWGALALLLVAVARGERTGIEAVGAVVSVGILLGGLGINVAHELGHRAGRTHRAGARLLLLAPLYLHFLVEHNRGHHLRVATEEDPASSRRGEWLYAFLARSVVGSAISAFRLEAERLGRAGRSPLSLRNEVLVGWLLQGALVAGVAVASPAAALAWVGAAAVGIALLETVNYVEHYGLRRTSRPDGRPEPVRPRHSWNSNHSVGRALLFDLTRHSDHHANPRRPYPTLRHFDEAPQLPTGYPGMMVLAAVPPLFFAVMDRRVDALRTA